MTTFLRIAEVWVPSADGAVLELADGLFDAAPDFGAISRGMRFARGNGLPGHAWAEGRPLLLSQLEGSYFRRAAEARAAGLCCAIGLPIFMAGRLTSVVVLLCGESAKHVGAIELWHNDPRISAELMLDGGYFGSTEPALEKLSRDGGLQRGAGTPGRAWQQESAVFIEEVGDSKHFLRAQTAVEAGILRALAIPCCTLDRHAWVLSLLSSGSKPIARRVESWLPDDSGTRLQRAFGFCEVRGRLHANDLTAVPVDWLGPIATAWRSGVAQATSNETATGAFETGEAADCNLSSVLAIPVIADDVVSEVIALHF